MKLKVNDLTWQPGPRPNHRLVYSQLTGIHFRWLCKLPCVKVKHNNRRETPVVKVTSTRNKSSHNSRIANGDLHFWKAFRLRLATFCFGSASRCLVLGRFTRFGVQLPRNSGRRGQRSTFNAGPNPMEMDVNQQQMPSVKVNRKSSVRMLGLSSNLWFCCQVVQDLGRI